MEDELYQAKQELNDFKKELNQLRNEKELLESQVNAQIPKYEDKIDMIEALKEKVIICKKKCQHQKEIHQMDKEKAQEIID